MYADLSEGWQLKATYVKFTRHGTGRGERQGRTYNRAHSILIERIVTNAQYGRQDGRRLSGVPLLLLRARITFTIYGVRRRRFLVVDEPGRVQRDHAIVDARLEVRVRIQAVWGDVGGGNAKLDAASARAHIHQGESTENTIFDRRKIDKQSRQRRTSLLPLPKPLMTGPDSLIGNGGSGPPSGPATGSRGPSGRIVSRRAE